MRATFNPEAGADLLAVDIEAAGRAGKVRLGMTEFTIRFNLNGVHSRCENVNGLSWLCSGSSLSLFRDTGALSRSSPSSSSSSSLSEGKLSLLLLEARGEEKAALNTGLAKCEPQSEAGL